MIFPGEKGVIGPWFVGKWWKSNLPPPFSILLNFLLFWDDFEARISYRRLLSLCAVQRRLEWEMASLVLGCNVGIISDSFKHGATRGMWSVNLRRFFLLKIVSLAGVCRYKLKPAKVAVLFLFSFIPSHIFQCVFIFRGKVSCLWWTEPIIRSCNLNGLDADDRRSWAGAIFSETGHFPSSFIRLWSAATVFLYVCLWSVWSRRLLWTSGLNWTSINVHKNGGQKTPQV